jgi:hypothetical protein
MIENIALPQSGDLRSPVQPIPTDPADGRLVAGLALCLSGGGYRAMMFHVGAIWRLYETGLLRNMNRISSVSGGSMTAGVLGLKWARLFMGAGSDRGSVNLNNPAARFAELLKAERPKIWAFFLN